MRRRGRTSCSARLDPLCVFFRQVAVAQLDDLRCLVVLLGPVRAQGLLLSVCCGGHRARTDAAAAAAVAVAVVVVVAAARWPSRHGESFEEVGDLLDVLHALAVLVAALLVRLGLLHRHPAAAAAATAAVAAAPSLSPCCSHARPACAALVAAGLST